MAISREAYQALADIVGPENISDDPALCDSYSFQWLSEIARPDQSPFMPRPVAAIMPDSVEEIQLIVKTCNRYKIKVKPYSTGWYFYCAPQKDGKDTVQLDLRRMDRILDIDEKNMIAVVEPYVIGATLQAELMKLGLNCNISGGGAASSILAGATSYLGSGEYNFAMGTNAESMLALEWVTPAGDIVRTGSLGSGAGWFCGEGPGPSLRGICRGTMGARGGMGVYTKMALKVSHWPGPPVLPVSGTIPAYRAPISENLRVYCLSFPSWQAYGEFLYKMWNNEIGYVFIRMLNVMGEDLGPAFWVMYTDPTKTINDIEEIAARPEVKKLTEEMRFSLQIMLAGNYPGDIEHQENVLNRILVETGGWKIDKWLEPEFAEHLYVTLQRSGQRNLLWSYAGGYIGPWSQAGIPDYALKARKLNQAWGERVQKSGLLVQSGGDTGVGGSSGSGGGEAGFEEMAYYDPADKESVKGTIQFMHEATKDALENGFPPGKEHMYIRIGMTDEQLYQEDAGASQPIVYHLQRKIKELIDPNDLGDRLYHILPEPGK
ncbi:MAG: FAD-binding oxidoreductase [Dehalococcoidales bacterium]|nr:FAD-binding oxidoreductase [Dehalococcoidales bacterium]